MGSRGQDALTAQERQDRVKLDLGQSPRWQTLSIPYVFERAGVDADRPAVVLDDEIRSYGDVRDRARRVANALIADGTEEMDRVAILCSNCIEYIEIEVGIAAARAIMVPLNWRLSKSELGNLLKRSQAVAIFAHTRFVAVVEELRESDELPDLRTVIEVTDGEGGEGDYERLCAEASPERPDRIGLLDDPHEIIFTSGTTGDPKGVVWTNGTLLFNGLQQVVDFGLSRDDSVYVAIDLYYIGGRHDFTWGVLQQGGTVHIKASSNFDALDVVEYVAANRITRVLWVPTMLFEILRLPELAGLDLTSLRMIMCGGAPVSRATTERAQEAFPEADFIQVYGLTEGGGTVTFIPPEHARSKAGSAGKASMHVELRIVGPDGEEARSGEDGEIVVRAPSVTAGYWDAPPDLRDSIVDGWLHTGDVGYLDEEGFLFVSGRKRDLIISGGMNIFPSEVEDVLRTHPSVGDVAVIGVPDEKWGESVCAVIEPAPGERVVESELLDHCRGDLASYKKPKSIRIVEELPRTASGKAKKFELRRQSGERPMDRAPATVGAHNPRP